MAVAPIARPGFWSGLNGVSRILNIAYLRAIPVGTLVRIRSKVVQVGKLMIMLRGEIGSVDGKIIYCTCEHHKVYVASKPNL
jgi:acyl-coenzyme A thioesterase 13